MNGGRRRVQPEARHSAPRDETPTLSTERDHLARAVEALSGLAARGGLVVNYGAHLQLLVPPESVHSAAMYPLDVLEAENEGLVGYLLEQGLQDALGDRQVVTMLTRVEVDPTDSEFLRPSHPPDCSSIRTRRDSWRPPTIG